VNDTAGMSGESAAVQARTVQDYIDETPLWRDGTQVPVTPMTMMQWRI
jgi:putative MFS transporter